MTRDIPLRRICTSDACTFYTDCSMISVLKYGVMNNVLRPVLNCEHVHRLESCPFILEDKPAFFKALN